MHAKKWSMGYSTLSILLQICPQKAHSIYCSTDNLDKQADFVKKEGFDMRKRDTVERENRILKKQVDECKIVLGTITTASRRVAAIYSQSSLLMTFMILAHSQHLVSFLKYDEEGLFDLLTENMKVMRSILNGNVT